MWFIERVDNHESNTDLYPVLTAGENAPKIAPSTRSRYLTTSALNFTVPLNDTSTDSGPSCDIVNDKVSFRFLSGCSVGIGGIGGETDTENGTEGRIALHL